MPTESDGPHLNRAISLMIATSDETFLEGVILNSGFIPQFCADAAGWKRSCPPIVRASTGVVEHRFITPSKRLLPCSRKAGSSGGGISIELSRLVPDGVFGLHLAMPFASPLSEGPHLHRQCGKARGRKALPVSHGRLRLTSSLLQMIGRHIPAEHLPDCSS